MVGAGGLATLPEVVTAVEEGDNTSATVAAIATSEKLRHSLISSSLKPSRFRNARKTTAGRSDIEMRIAAPLEL